MRNMKNTVVAGKELDIKSTSNDNDDFISLESNKQVLLIKQQDEELDELSASVGIIGGVGITIHEELLAQEKIIADLGTEMESTSNRLDFVQVIVFMHIFELDYLLKLNSQQSMYIELDNCLNINSHQITLISFRLKRKKPFSNCIYVEQNADVEE
ncbi:Syntaxin-61 [Camellia lanceoleosa]|uniref:Syntaxin-61 n=1 Tax=Camellia lanceoleosa TaxID=1840588 RepID=A0ACC0H9U8_9ERIC|nr:Syntaxin-61 [Camellia lanceoleosa]